LRLILFRKNIRKIDRYIILFAVFLTISINCSTQNKIEFSGYKWNIKESAAKRVGPGNNYFTSNESNVYINDKGNLVLKISNENGIWFCTEVFSEKSFGYGTYIIEIEKTSLFMHRSVVFGFFTYDSNMKRLHNEIDIEFSKWSKKLNKNSQYVLHNRESDYPIYRFNSRKLRNSTHLFEWYPDSIVYRSYDYPFEKIDTKKPYSQYTIKKTSIPIPLDEKVHINLWLTGNSRPIRKQQNFVIKKFEFIPLSL
jgi:hypothetical protein